MIATAPTQNSHFSLERNGLPNVCGSEAELTAITNHNNPVFLPRTNLNLDSFKASFACALHMHQPTIPAGTNGELICNLQHMMENPHDGDNHNASVFAYCYSRMGDFIPELIEQGCNPRIMLDYSGNLLWGLIQMGRQDVIDNLKKITLNDRYWPHVEWLGTMWSHAVAPSTPIPDLKLQIQAWQQYFAAIFGTEALARVKGFSPPEMHLPNNPDTLYEYIKALKECGYRWLMVQEGSVETLDGTPVYDRDEKYLPQRLVATNSRGDTISMTALIKTQGSDTKLVAQMQPYYEAKSRGRQELGGQSVPCCVTQIADGENGGVMMNEFPDGYKQAWPLIAGDGSTVGVNGTEYLELLDAAGISEERYPVCQAIQQHKIWARVDRDNPAPGAVDAAIADLNQNDHQFSMDGASWTNDLSWVRGYENVLEPMNQLSAKFHEKFDRAVAEDPSVTQSREYTEALLYVMLVETSCFRYWGQGTWTDYARELYRRGEALVS